MFINVYSIYDFISFFVVIVYIYIFYSLEPILILGSGLCLFFHDFLKEVTTGWYAPIFKRPDGAMNCSLFNTGCLVEHKSGFPSGHVTIISFFMNILWSRSKTNLGIKGANNWMYTILYNLPIVLMGYARIMKGCHNLIQVVAGYLLGYGVASIMYIYEHQINDSFYKLRNSASHYIYKTKGE